MFNPCLSGANIFLSSNGSIKLGDFGLCVSLDERLNEAVEGDAVYMAPELMQGNFGKPADVFRSVITSVKNCRFVTLPFFLMFTYTRMRLYMYARCMCVN